MNHFIDILKGLLRDTPVFAMLAWHWFVAALPTILLVLAFIYAIMNISYLWWKWSKEAKKDQ